MFVNNFKFVYAKSDKDFGREEGREKVPTRETEPTKTPFRRFYRK